MSSLTTLSTEMTPRSESFCHSILQTSFKGITALCNDLVYLFLCMFLVLPHLTKDKWVYSADPKWPPICFFNKVLLEQSLSEFFAIVWGCSPAAVRVE